MRLRSAIGLLALLVACADNGSPPGDPSSAATGGGGGDGAGSGASSGGGVESGPTERWWGKLALDDRSDGWFVLAAEGSLDGSAQRFDATLWWDLARHDVEIERSEDGWLLLGQGMVDGCRLWLHLVRTGDAFDVRDGGTCPTRQDGSLGVLRRSRARRVHADIDHVDPLGFDLTGRRFAYAAEGGIHLWDSEAGRLLDLGPGMAAAEMQAPHRTGVVFSADGRRAAFLRGQDGCVSTELVAVDVQTGEAEAIASRVPCHAAFVRFSPDGGRAAYFADAGGELRQLHVFSFAEGSAAALGEDLALDSLDMRVFWGPDGRYLLHSLRTSEILLGPTNDPVELKPVALFDAATGEVRVLGEGRELRASADGRHAAFINADDRVVLVDLAAGTDEELDTAYNDPALDADRAGITFSGDGTKLGFVDGEGALRLHDLERGEAETLAAGVGCFRHELPGAPSAVRALRFSSDGSAVLFVPRSITTCTERPQLTGVRWRELATARELDLDDEVDEIFRFGPRGEIAYENWPAGLKAWSPEHGGSLVAAQEDIPSSTTAEFTSDGKFLVFTPVDFDDLLGVYAWNLTDHTLAALKLGRPAADSFVLEPERGIVIVPGTPSMRYHLGAGGEGEPLVDESGSLLRSESSATLAIAGRRGGEEGIFALRVGDGDALPALIEAGRIVSVSDSHVYFVAPDGLCVAPL
ncbi:WD40 repeat domain-containing protein [Sorangium sp. So ce394]|uniref:WD40 repeat domain-containing protein n=1 Tax=Sorangium sp. So ce394 TaxID=3133310 RepID=UPI003F5BEE2F